MVFLTFKTTAMRKKNPEKNRDYIYSNVSTFSGGLPNTA